MMGGACMLGAVLLMSTSTLVDAAGMTVANTLTMCTSSVQRTWAEACWGWAGLYPCTTTWSTVCPTVIHPLGNPSIASQCAAQCLAAIGGGGAGYSTATLCSATRFDAVTCTKMTTTYPC